MSRVVLSVAWCLFAFPVLGAEPSPRDLLPEKPALWIELRQPVRLIDHPLVQRVWSELSRSAEVQRRLESPEYDRVRQLRQFVEGATGTDWKTGLDRLTAGGVALSVEGRPGDPPTVTVVTIAADEETLQKAVAAFQGAVLQRIPADRRPAALPSESYQGVACVQIGEARYAVAGRRLILANRPEGLRAAIDRLKTAAPRSAGGDSSSIVRAEIDLAQLRAAPQFQKGLSLPSNDIGQVFFLGGWIDVLSRADRGRIDLTAGEATLDLRLQVAAGRKDARPGLAGFFAAENGARALPPLRVPGMIASSSWHRDYAALWKGRDAVLTPEAKTRLDEGDAQAKKQFEVLGARFLPSELFAEMGTHFRIVVARQSELVYKVDLPERLPAAAFLVDTRTDGFREKLTPLFRFGGILAAADGRRMVTNTETYKTAELTSFRFREDAETQATGTRNRYQFSPTWTFTRNHLIVGSTTVIVRQAIDALDAEAAAGDTAALPEFTTESQVLSPVAAAAAMNDFRTALLNSTVLSNGISLSDAEHELSVLTHTLEALRGVATRTTFDDEKLEVHLRVGE